MNLGTHNGVIDDQPAPSLKHLARIREDGEEFLQLVGVAIRTVNAQTQAIHVNRSGADIPEFRDILGREEERMLTSIESNKGLSGYATCRMALLNASQQNIRINQNLHLPTVRIHAGAADGLI